MTVAATPRYPIPGLTPRQRAVFEQIAVGNDAGHHPKTVGVLLDRGAIEVTWEVRGRDRFGEIRVPRYTVPLGLHVRWCQWCADQEGEDR